RTASILGLVALLLAAGGGIFVWQKYGNSKAPGSSGSMKLTRIVTGGGDLGNASISPDGRYLAYALFKGNTSSLRLRQVSTGGDREIVPPIDDGGILWTVFSPDGEFVYYHLNHRDKAPLGALFQIPVIG